MKWFFEALTFAFVEVPLKLLIRFVAFVLLTVEMLLIFAPCFLIEVIFFSHNTPFHSLAYTIGDLSEKLIDASDFRYGFKTCLNPILDSFRRFMAVPFHRF